MIARLQLTIVSRDLASMASRRPVAVDTLERVVPEWPARASTETTSRTDAVRLHDTEPMEFILSSNWALRTEGVKDFYEVLYKRDEVTSLPRFILHHLAGLDSSLICL